jgi:hypothetical protein
LAAGAGCVMRSRKENFPSRDEPDDPSLSRAERAKLTRAIRESAGMPKPRRRRNSKKKAVEASEPSPAPISGEFVTQIDSQVETAVPAAAAEAVTAPRPSSAPRCPHRARPCLRCNPSSHTLAGGLLGTGHGRVQGTGSPLEPAPGQQGFVTAGGRPATSQRPPEWDGIRLVGF